VALIAVYAEMLPALHASRQLDAVTVSLAPHMEQRKRADILADYRRDLGVTGRPRTPIDPAALAAIGITVETGDTDG